MIVLQSNPPSGPTFIHVFGEPVEDASRGRCVKKFHGTTKNLLKKFLMEPRGGTQSTLKKKNKSKDHLLKHGAHSLTQQDHHAKLQSL